MPHTKFQVVFSPDDRVELQMLIDGEMRGTNVDLQDAPFSPSMLSDPAVANALKAWMLEAKGPVWMNWTDVEEVIKGAGIDLTTLLSAFPATRP